MLDLEADIPVPVQFLEIRKSMTTIRSKILLTCGVLVLFAILFAVLRVFTAGNALSAEIMSIEKNIPVPLKSLRSMAQYEIVCILPPYAVQPGAQDDSLSKIFGDVRYEDWKENILARHAGIDEVWTFYPVSDGRVVDAVPIKLPMGAYLSTEPRFFGRCYSSTAICLRRLNSRISLGSCSNT